MKLQAPSPVQAFAVSLALVRGLGELVSLQRWRLKAWLAR
jgi:hypothetical protein